MNQLALDKPHKNHDPICDLMKTAEQELASFFNAVRKPFGPEQAEVAAEDWLHELLATNNLPASTLQWRQLTVKVMVRLVSRVKNNGRTLQACP